MRDPAWQFVGAVLALLAIAVGVAIYLAQRGRKALPYRITTAELVSVHQLVRARMQVLLDGQPVEDLHLVLVTLENIGRVPITAADFERPLTIAFADSEAEIVSYGVADTRPENMGATVALGLPGSPARADAVALAPVLFNPGDRSRVSLMVSTARPREIAIDARVVNLPRLTTGDEYDKARGRRFSAAAIAAGVGIAGASFLSRNAPVQAFGIGAGVAIVIAVLQALLEGPQRTRG